MTILESRRRQRSEVVFGCAVSDPQRVQPRLRRHDGVERAGEYTDAFCRLESADEPEEDIIGREAERRADRRSERGVGSEMRRVDWIRKHGDTRAGNPSFDRSPAMMVSIPSAARAR